jgi:hypothetical protein
MNVPSSVNPNYVFFVSMALFIVWMQRNGRWNLMIGTMDGTYKIRSTK